MKILIVEDDNMIREGISEYLSEFGYTVIQAKDGREALTKFNSDINLVILDIQIPFINGLEVLKEIRKKSNLPILILTAFSDEEYKIDEQDLKQLMQVFNRGGFSEGHLNEKENKELIYSKKPNNMGLYLGNIVHYNKLKGLITLESHENLSIGDTISVEKEDYTYTVSELMIKDKNVVSATEGKTITFGRMKGNISVGDKVYKLSSKTLDNAVKYSYENYENKKITSSAIINLILNYSWTFIFFKLKMYIISAIELVLIILSTIKFIIELYKENKTAAFLQFPYLVWLLVALYLNIGVIILN